MKPIPYFSYMKKTTNKILHSDEKLLPEQQQTNDGEEENKQQDLFDVREIFEPREKKIDKE